MSGEWRYATAAWDGEARIDNGNKYTDSVTTTEGRLFAFGMPTQESAAGLRDLIAEQAARSHNCDREPGVEEALVGGGAEGIYAEHKCLGSTVLRWYGVNDGFGLFVGLIVAGNVEPADAAALFKQQISELEWTE